MAKERILIIDGDISLIETLRWRLEEMGYFVDCAKSGNEAFDILERKWVDLIILSSILKGEIQGIQVFKKIRSKKRLSKIPVVMQSSKDVKKEMFEMIGIKSLYTKPCCANTFITKIRRALAKK